MKVYRVVPEVLSYKPMRFPFATLESLYYELGYISFAGKIYEGYSNNISRRVKDEGKYFFVFIEDAAYFITQNTQEASTWKLMEYDFPEDVVYSIIGCGRYYDNIKAETYIEKRKIPGEIISSDVISEDEKMRLMINDYRRTYAAEVEYKKNNNTQYEKGGMMYSDPEPFTRFLNYRKEKFGERYDNVNLLTDKEILGMVEDERETPRFLRQTQELVKTSAITGKSAVLVYLWSRREIPSLDEYNRESIIKSGFNLDYSKEGIALRDDYAKLIYNEQYNDAKQLLKSYRK